MMGMARVSAQYKLAIVGAAASAVLLLAVLGFGYVVSEIRRGDAARRELQIKIAEVGEERRLARVSEGLLRKREEDSTRIRRFFADRKNPLAFIEAAEHAAARTGNTVALDIDEGGSREQALRFQLTVEGEERGLLRFIAALELLPYRIDMEEMVFQSQASEGSAGGRPQGPSARLVLALHVGVR